MHVEVMDPATGLYPRSLILQTEQLVLPSTTNAELGRQGWRQDLPHHIAIFSSPDERSLGFANHAASKLHKQRAEGPILEFDTHICQISVCCPRMSD